MDATDTDGLARRLELLWGERAGAERRSRPGLSLERVVGAAIEVADAEGLAQLSMSRVADRLGFTTMSLYRYVRSKDELLMLMEEAAIGPPPPLPGPDDGWRAGLQEWVRQHLAIYHRHPWLLQIPISGPPLTPNNLLWFERGLRILGATGLRAEEKVGVIQLVAGYVRNEAQLSRDLLAAEAAAVAAGGEPVSYGRMLAKLIDTERFPALSEMVADGVFDIPEGYSEEDFDFGLQRVLDGVEVLVRTRAE
ncbi:TetR/AcrR family transcriptional regulator [Solwaraspora sp. WMMD1047]|uniref:TetR/AcrR family transcriptional regulator n=1 Tax=Solwaraspora sp. WMMD1047 TaxID=3016102 RepID=UPI002417477B|nr:TetR/AcrR family transcriptional regulator [Solwaraspora sp. WMMD1047]MDG4829675.1 TetR/AcrR family transcriptional regulator [Solwaraspora sp. WMMD1047]